MTDTMIINSLTWNVT